MTFLIEIIENQTCIIGFKWWFRCDSSNGYLDKFDLYLGLKKDVEVNLGESVGIQLSEKLKGTYCALFPDNFFNSLELIDKISQDEIYAIGSIQ